MKIAPGFAVYWRLTVRPRGVTVDTYAFDRRVLEVVRSTYMGPVGYGDGLVFKCEWPIARRILRTVRRELGREADIGWLTTERQQPLEFRADLPFDLYEQKANALPESVDRVSL